MPKNPPENSQRLIPSITYADAPAAIEFLCKAFGFEETFRFTDPEGKVGHASLAYAGEQVASVNSEYAEAGLKSPRELPAVSIGLYCYVDDVDAHYERAKAAGATIVAEPTDQFYGDRTYRTVDPEGHRWTFGTRVRDVEVEDSKPVE